LLAEYLLELAGRFNGFYNQEQILGVKEEGMRVRLTEAVVTVLGKGMELLGVEVPEKM